MRLGGQRKLAIEMTDGTFCFLLKSLFFLHTNHSLPPHPTLSHFPPKSFPIYSSEIIRPPMEHQHIKLRQDQAPPRCIKAEQGLPPQGMGFKSHLIHQVYILQDPL